MGSSAMMAVGAQGQGARDGNALALTAGELAGQCPHDRLAAGPPCSMSFVDALLARLLGAHVVNEHGVEQLVVDGHACVQGGGRDPGTPPRSRGRWYALSSAVRLVTSRALEVHVAARGLLQAAASRWPSWTCRSPTRPRCPASRPA